MRVLSVVFIFATLAIFGVMGCDIQCPEGGDTSAVCNKIGDYQFTTTRCESNNLIKCVMSQDNEVVTVTDGACALHNLTTCENYCPKGRPVCSLVYGKKKPYRNVCTYVTVQNCREAYEKAYGLPRSEVKLLFYGEC